jgi:hypothetical protein
VVALVPDVGQRTRYYAEERALYASDYEDEENSSAVDASSEASSESGAADDGAGSDSNAPSKDSAGADRGSAGDAAVKADST